MDTAGEGRIILEAPGNSPGAVELRLWDGTALRVGTSKPAATVIFRDARAFRDLLLFRDPLRLARDFFRGRVDLEGNIYAAIGLKDCLERFTLSFRERLALLARALLPRAAHAPGDKSPATAPRAAHYNSPASIAFHYDLSNESYRLWLDQEMVYSCAYFSDPSRSLEQAQRDKLDIVCRKLRLAPGERFLDIGCGWGALVIHAARQYGVRAHGVTLSRRQFEHARARIDALGLAGRVTVELRDYRDLDPRGPYDKIASIGMFEHVGLKRLPGYFAAAHRLLARGGLFLNHGITSREGGWRRTLSTDFINRYVFPDGELDSVANIQRVMEEGGFEVLDVEALRPHYAATLRHWVARLEARRDEAVREVGEATYRVWRFYMAACALQFEQGDTGVYQILLGRGREPWPACVRASSRSGRERP
jgi:cyclopropane-fatty-acyl-phospholipid synthase